MLLIFMKEGINLKKFKQLNLFISTIMVLVFISGQSAFAKSSVSTSSSSSRSSSSTVSKTSGSGFKTGSFNNSSTTSKNASSTSKSTSSNSSGSKSNTVTNSTKSVNTNSKALNNIPSSYSSHSVSNNYYYNTSNGGSDFWSNYWLYRSLTPEHRTYVIDNSTVVAPSYTGFKSIVPDVITICVLIAILGFAIYLIKKRTSKH